MTNFCFQPLCLCETQSRWTDDLRTCGSRREAWRRRCDGVGVLCWWQCHDLFRIQGTLNQHGYHSILQQYATLCHPIWFALSGTGQWPNTPPGCARAIWPRWRVMECCIRCPGLDNHPTSSQLRFFGMSWIQEWRKSSQQVLKIYGNSFKAVWKAFQVKLVERMPRVCKAVIKAKGGYFEESKIYFDSFNTFLVTTWFQMCYFIVLMSSLLL